MPMTVVSLVVMHVMIVIVEDATSIGGVTAVTVNANTTRECTAHPRHTLHINNTHLWLCVVLVLTTTTHTHTIHLIHVPSMVV